MDRLQISTRPLGRLIEQLSLSVADIGARGGADEDLLDLAWASTLYAFEPEPSEAERLEAVGDARWSAFRVLSVAVGATSGSSTLHIPGNPAGASLMEHNPEMLSRFGYRELHEIGKTVEVETRTLDELSEAEVLSRVDYLKLDIEGPELGVMKAGLNVLKDCAAVKTECSFLEQRSGQPLTWEVAQFLIGQGFQIVEIHEIHRWRRRNLPGHPFLTNAKMPYSKGQLAQCDLIALRDPASCGSFEQAMRLAIIAAALGYFDFAIDVVRSKLGLAESISAQYGFDIESELFAWSRAAGRRVLRSRIRRQVRDLVPMIRSLFGRLPFSRSANEAY